MELFDPASSNEKIMVMFTDGRTTAGGDASPAAASARAQGVIIYGIGLSGNGGIDEDALKDWASDPDSAYVAITPNDEELEDLFEDLAENISKPGATNLVVTDQVGSCFRILTVDSPSKGSAVLLDERTVQWKIAQLGAKQSEGAVLTFTVEHEGPCSGLVEVNESVSYTDDEKNVVKFPSPKIRVDCDMVICPEACPDPKQVTIGGCEDTVEYNVGELGLDSPGRILQLDVTLKNVCPHRRVALAAILHEVDEEGREYKRGMKTITVPAHDRTEFRDVTVRCIRFVLPEDLDVSGDPDSICNQRKFKARFIAHYIDSDFECCCEVTV
ncbi:MAG: VWA domain-containing protein [Firmicutes bacterium]|nr:VWA domain-containing protein [Bacillota bacterium]